MAHRVQERHVNEGQSKTITVTCKTGAGDLADPTTLTAVVLTPTGVPTTYTHGVDGEWVKVSLGVFAFTFTPSVGGHMPWLVRVKIVMADGTQAVAIAEVFVDTDSFS